MPMTVEQIAKAAHTMNRQWCEAHGDHSQLSWKDAPDWQKESAINGVQAIIMNPDTTPQKSHENWMTEKVADGWVYGEVKDPKAKTHPCMVPYFELPEDQRAKDLIFTNTVKTLIAANSGGYRTPKVA